MNKQIKVCYILAYRDPTYIRTRVLLGALEAADTIDVYEALNSSKGLLRYIEATLKAIYIRLRYRPDVYILGFRGHEMLLPVRLITLGKPLVFDEFINLNNWLVEEHNKLKKDSIANKVILMYMKWLIRNVECVLSDTNSGAEYSHKLYGGPLSKYYTVYVGADESVFYPRQKKKLSEEFTVLFYGTALPLHGIEVLLHAAKQLREVEDIKFEIIGGKGKPEMVELIEGYIRKHKLTNVDYRKWVEFEKLPHHIANADICLGGPFGGTSQSKRVITGKTYQFLAMAKPTIVGQIEENAGFEDKENCLLVKQNSAEDLVDKISWARKNKSKLAEIASGGRALYKQEFSSDVVQQRIKNIIGELHEN